MGCGTQGVVTKLCMEPLASPHTFDTLSEPYKFWLCELQKQQKLVTERSNTGSRSIISTMRRQGPYLAGGNLGMYMNAGDLDLLLPRTLGAAESLDVFEIADTLPTFGILVNRVEDTEQFKDCAIARAIYRGRATTGDEEEPIPVEMIYQILAKEHVTGTTYPVLTLPTTAQYVPYIFEEGVFTINSVARTIYDFSILVDNHVLPRFANQLYPVGLCPQGRTVKLAVTIQHDTTNYAGLFEYPDAGYTSATLVFTKGGVVTTFTFALLKAADVSPVIRGQDEVLFKMEFVALKNGSTSEIVVTNDSAP